MPEGLQPFEQPHNAIVHNLPTGGTVWVTTTMRANSAVPTVETTGELLAASKLATLGEPFARGTERNYTDHAGVGLGLTIGRSIADAHGGTLTLRPRAGGGLVATVELPRAPGT